MRLSMQLDKQAPCWLTRQHSCLLSTKLRKFHDVPLRHKRSQSVTSLCNPKTMESDDSWILLPSSLRRRSLHADTTQQAGTANEINIEQLSFQEYCVSTSSNEMLPSILDDHCILRTPKSEPTEYLLSPPPLEVASYIHHLDVSSAIEKGIFLPDLCDWVPPEPTFNVYL